MLGLNSRRIIAACFAAILSSSAAPARAILFTNIVVTPSPRGDQARAINGNLGDYSYLTASFSTGLATAFLDLGAATSIGGFRFYKQFSDIDAIGSNNLDRSNLTFHVSTTSTLTPLASRTYSAVSGLTNGDNGTELLVLDGGTVNTGTATVTREFGAGQAWYSVRFDNVPNATAIAFRFTPSAGESGQFTHYPVAEFEALGAAAVVPEPSSVLLLAPGIFTLLGIRRLHRKK